MIDTTMGDDHFGRDTGPDARRLRRGPGQGSSASASASRPALGTGPISRRAIGSYGGLWLRCPDRAGRGRIPGERVELYPPGLPERRQAPDDDLARTALQRDHLGPGLVRPVDDVPGPAQDPCARPVAPRTPPFDDDGKILWPSTIPPDDPGARAAAGRGGRRIAVVRESKSTGHASIRPVIAAKNKLSAFERKVMPVVKAKNVTDGDALDTFFFNLDNALDTLTYTY